jgi:hypothetical protein
MQQGELTIMKKLHALVCTLSALVIFGPNAVPIFGQTATTPYVLTVFAKAHSGLSAPDSVAVLGDHVFVGYGDGHEPDGSDGLNSQVVEYASDGAVVHIYTVVGHNDGIKVDPATHLVWALQNEDANANLVVINPETRDQKQYSFGPTLHGGGYDDMVFRAVRFISVPRTPRITRTMGPPLSAPACKEILLPWSPCCPAKPAP